MASVPVCLLPSLPAPKVFRTHILHASAAGIIFILPSVEMKRFRLEADGARIDPRLLILPQPVERELCPPFDGFGSPATALVSTAHDMESVTLHGCDGPPRVHHQLQVVVASSKVPSQIVNTQSSMWDSKKQAIEAL